MKKKGFIITSLLLATSCLLSGCLSYFEENTEPDSYDNVPEKTLSKTKIMSTYEDYNRHNIYPIDSAPLSVDAKLLVIPIWFVDSSSYIANDHKQDVRQAIYKSYFGSVEETGWHSVSSYYAKESLDKYHLKGTVSSWYECGKKSTAFYTDDANTNSLVVEATNWYFNSTTESRKDYDADGNGYLDGVVLIYGAPDQNHIKGANADNMWAYTFWLQNTSYKNVNNPGPNSFFWASFDFMFDDSAISSITGIRQTGSGNCLYCNIDAHTYIHEMGHMLGLEDYYDYSGQYNPAGGFSMQDYNVGGHDPFSVMAFGWANPYIPTESCKIKLGNFQNTHDLILLTPKWNSINSPFDEYLLLELYSATGLNEADCKHSYRRNYAGPLQTGIRLWHVDACLIENVNGKYYRTNNPTNNPVTVIMRNTYPKEGKDLTGYLSVLGEDYYNYNLLSLIKNDTKETHKSETLFSSRSMFYKSDIFDMKTYGKQFVNDGELDLLGKLGWSFKVTSLNDNEATISLIRE